MSYRWRYEDQTGSPVTGPEVTFEDRTAAEDWLGREFEELLDQDVHQVTLLDGADEVYGPMGLNPV